jgi:hypothetical protein
LSYGTREEWLNAGLEELNRILFLPREMKLPEVVKVSCGLCPGKAIGICVDPERSDKGYTEIFIAPIACDPIEVLATLAHEAVHAILGQDEKHGPRFKAAVRDIGLDGKATATYATPGGELHGILQEISVGLGDYPHSPLRKKDKPKKAHNWISFISVSNEEFIVRANKVTVKELGPPRDYNGEPMVAKDPTLMEDDGEEKEDSDDES